MSATDLPGFDTGRYAVRVRRDSISVLGDAELRRETHTAVTRHLVGAGASMRDAQAAADLVVQDHVGPGVQVVALTAESLAAFLRIARGGAR